MLRTNCLPIFIVPILLLSVSMGASQANVDLNGRWKLIPEKSSEISLYGTLSVGIEQKGVNVTITQKWGERRSLNDTLRLRTDGKFVTVLIKNRVFPSNVFMGLSMPVGATRKVKATWEDNGSRLRLDDQYEIHGSQGLSPMAAVHTFELSNDKELLIYRIVRSTRKTGPEEKYVLKREGFKDAFYVELEDNWEIEGKLPVNAFLISLQGVANAGAPRLYILYPENWPFNYVRPVFNYYREERNYTFTQLRTPENALTALKDYVKGFVVWDKSVRTSLIVAFTVAGLEKAVVVSEDLIHLAEKAGLKPVADFRGKFTGQTDAQIYSWAMEQYWDRCSRDVIIWLGGEHGNIMKPGIADWGIYQKAFFQDLSTKPEHKEEYALANKLLGQMKPLAMVQGWHSYAKDLERDHVKLCSSYGLRVEGLHTIPNLSFSHQVPATPGFVFKNNHHIVPGKDYTPEAKVYLTCVQTDGMGIGAYHKPGRGEIPYAWECIMNYLWLAPAMQEYFYSKATPNDYFIGALSGPGYMYPKAVPPDKLPVLIAKAREMMEQLDLKVFEIMDYSEGATVEGNTELTKQVVDAYYKGMPNAIGFLNGYAPAYTFASRDGRPLLSYDYYLSPTRTEADAVADLEELATINSQRPYFLLMHVRESSDIKRVKSILDKLSPQFEVVPLDVFLAMAGKKPTFKERFLSK